MMHLKKNKRWITSLKPVLILLLMLLTAGCASDYNRSIDTPAPIVQNNLPGPSVQNKDFQATEGSLWTENGPMTELFTPQRAAGVGDILTVRIIENSSASNRASTATERESNIKAGIDKLFGLEKDYPAGYVPGHFPWINPFSGVQADIDNEYDAQGTTKRSGNLAATITVRVVEKLHDGNLRIAGSREVLVNNERQYITLTGLVRPIDISWNNTVLSTYISDAQIAYSGVGVINDRQKPGWAMRVLDVIWPF